MIMRNRILHVLLTEEEFRALHDQVGKTGMSLSAFVRASLAGQEIREAPGADVPVLIRELRRVGDGLYRLLQAAGPGGMPEAGELRKALDENRRVEKLVLREYGRQWR